MILRHDSVRQAGFTLIELMIAVAIVGILASVAVFMFSKSSNKAKVTSEVPGMLAEFKMKEERYYVENSKYLSTGTGETDPHPSSPAGNDKPTTLTTRSEWQSLRLAPDKASLYCSYVAIAGDAGDDTNIGYVANQFGMPTAPDAAWYYVIAECDVDGRGGTNALYFTSSNTDEIFKQNEGK